MGLNGKLTTATRSSGPRSTGSDPWSVCRAWRKMFLALQDAGNEAPLKYAASTLAGLAPLYASTDQARDRAREALVAVESGDWYRATSAAVSALRSSEGSVPPEGVDDAVCALIRALAPLPPPGFGRIARLGEAAGDLPRVRPIHVAHVPTT